MKYHPRQIANAFIHRSRQSHGKITHLKVQKLSVLLYQKQPDVFAEAPETWPFGVVFSSLFHELKTFGSRPINGLLTEVDMDSKEIVALVPNGADAKFWDAFNYVWDNYSHMSDEAISLHVHKTYK